MQTSMISEPRIVAEWRPLPADESLESWWVITIAGQIERVCMRSGVLSFWDSGRACSDRFVSRVRYWHPVT